MAEQGGDEKQLAGGGESLDGNLDSIKLNSFKIATPGVHDNGGARRSASYGGRGGGGCNRKQPEHVSTFVPSFRSCIGGGAGWHTNRLFRVDPFDPIYEEEVPLFEEEVICNITSGCGTGSGNGGGEAAVGGNGGGEAAVGGGYGGGESAVGGRFRRFRRWWKKWKKWWRRFTKNR